MDRRSLRAESITNNIIKKKHMGNEEVEAVNVFVRLGSAVARNHPQISVPYIASFLCSMSWVECSTWSLRSLKF